MPKTIKQYVTVRELYNQLGDLVKFNPNMPVVPQVFTVGDSIELRTMTVRLQRSKEFIEPDTQRVCIIERLAPPAYAENGAMLDEPIAAVQISAKHE